jgi:hypothetical protein
VGGGGGDVGMPGLDKGARQAVPAGVRVFLMA